MQNPTNDYAHQVAERISREFNERLCAFLARAVARRTAAELRLDDASAKA